MTVHAAENKHTKPFGIIFKLYRKVFGAFVLAHGTLQALTLLKVYTPYLIAQSDAQVPLNQLFLVITSCGWVKKLIALVAVYSPWAVVVVTGYTIIKLFFDLYVYKRFRHDTISPFSAMLYITVVDALIWGYPFNDYRFLLMGFAAMTIAFLEATMVLRAQRNDVIVFFLRMVMWCIVIGGTMLFALMQWCASTVTLASLLHWFMLLPAYVWSYALIFELVKACRSGKITADNEDVMLWGYTYRLFFATTYFFTFIVATILYDHEGNRPDHYEIE